MSDPANFKLLRSIDRERDHVRGGDASGHVVNLVYYGDFLCPYCRRLRAVLKRLREAIGDRLAYCIPPFPKRTRSPRCRVHGARRRSCRNQGRFWEMYDALFDKEPPFAEDDVRELARKIGLDMVRFERDLDSEKVRARVAEHLAEAKRNGVSGTPTIFIDGVRYDGAWDYYSLLDVFERPVGERIQRSARAFASLPASGGLALILSSLAALSFANSPLAVDYYGFIHAPFGIGPRGSLLSLAVGEWFSEGLLAFFFLLVGLEIRREMTGGALADRRAATLPIVAAIIASIVPAAIYLVVNPVVPCRAGRCRPRPILRSR